MRLPAIPAIDALLLLMVLIWGSNFTVVKSAFAHFPPHGFNALRLVIASALFVTILTARRRRVPIAAADWPRIAGLAVVGHLLYQLCFIGGLARTEVANSSVIIGCTPIVVTLLSAARGHDRVAPLHWAGAGLSVLGVLLVVGGGAAITRTTIVGDLLIAASVLCWAVYTVEGRPLLARHSPLVVTGYTMAIGSALYLPLGAPQLVPLQWGGIAPAAWGAVVYSAVFALAVAYVIWYTAVQRIGNARTAMYSNMVPVAAMAIAALWLGEPVPPMRIAGAAAVLLGVGLARYAGARTIPSPK